MNKNLYKAICEMEEEKINSNKFYLIIKEN